MAVNRKLLGHGRGEQSGNRADITGPALWRDGSHRSDGPSEQDFESLVEGLYDVAAGTMEWSDLLVRYSTICGGQSAALIAVNTQDGALDTLRVHNMTADNLRDYAEHYGEVDPIRAHALIHRPTKTFTEYGVITEREMDRHEYYADFLAGMGLRYTAAECLRLSPSLIGTMSLNFSARQGPAGRSLRRFIDRLTPHLARAWEIRRRLSTLEEDARYSTEALDRLESAVLLLDGSGRVTRMNRAAEAVLAAGDGLVLSGGRLAAANSRDRNRLVLLTGGAIAAGSGRIIEGGGAMSVSRRPPRRPLQLLVAPLTARQSENRFGPALVEGRALVTVTDPENRPRPPHEILSAIYGLTPAEARLAAELAGGDGLDEIAERLGITRETARSTLKQIYVKTDTHRQAELVSLLLTAPVPGR